MNDQKILELIAQNPKVRVVQLADKLDMEAADVQAALAGLIAVGDVVQSSGFAPNGLSANLYDLSPAFMQSERYANMARKAAAANFATPVAGMTKVDRAIAFIKAQPGASATSAELHALLGLDPLEYVSSYLSSAVRAGKVVKDGKNWTLGDGTPPAPAREAKNAAFNPINGPKLPPTPVKTAEEVLEERPLSSGLPPELLVQLSKSARDEAAKARAQSNVVTIEAEPYATLSMLIPPIAHLPAPAVEPPAPVYRCAIWSDGVIEIQRNGRTVAQLTSAEADALVAFMTTLPGRAAA